MGVCSRSSAAPPGVDHLIIQDQLPAFLRAPVGADALIVGIHLQPVSKDMQHNPGPYMGMWY